MATWTLENAAHLLKRAAFGGSPSQIEDFFDRHSSVEEAVDTLLGFAPSKKSPPKPKDLETDSRIKMQRWWLKTMLKSAAPDACREKLVLFFHNFLVSGTDKQPELRFMSWQNRTFRLLCKGSFKDLIREFVRDPANLYYLDGKLNDARDGIGQGPGDTDIVVANENFGRELMELFTLGPFQLAADGLDDPANRNYDEDDVHNVARAATGWIHIDGEIGVFDIDAYDGGQYDDNGDGNPDTITIFGQSSDNFRLDAEVAGTSDDVLELIFTRQDLAGNNQVGMFVARKFWEWYAYPAPAAGLKAVLADIAAEFVAADFSLEALMRAMFTHDEFYSNAAKSRTVKNPVDYVIQSFKTLGVRGNAKYVGDSPVELGQQVSDMGMNLFQPPNVAGWPGALSWITSGTLIERLRFVRYFTASDFGSHRIRFSKLDKLVLGDANADPATVVDQIVQQLGLDLGPLALTQDQKDVLIAYATDDGAITTLDLSSEFTDDVQTKVRGILSLALQSAEAQLF